MDLRMIKMATKTALRLSIAFILLMWAIKAGKNILCIESILALFESLPRVFLQSFVTAVFYILCITFFLWLSKERYRDIGFTKDNVTKQLGNGILFGALIFLLDTFLISPLTEAILPATSARGIDMSKLFGNTSYLLVFLFIGLFKGGLSEELWRIFILTRFEKIFGRAGLVFALVVSSLVFGIGHLYQGLSGMVSISIIGFLYALVYLRKRMALEAIVAHSTENLISIVLGYVIYGGT